MESRLEKGLLFHLSAPMKPYGQLKDSSKYSASMLNSFFFLFRSNIPISLLLIICLLLLLYLRIMFMGFDLWLDEAWVANSVAAPSISQMIYFDKWVQTTPPFLLIILRTATVFGENELTLRLVPWIAGLLSILVMARVLGRIFSFPLVVIGTTFFAANYYALKYSQQAKQYSTDLLLSCLFLIVSWTILESGLNRKGYWAICLLGIIGIFISFTIVFWLPIGILVVMLSSCHLSDSDHGTNMSDGNFRRVILLLILYCSSAVLLYFPFIKPNLDPNLLRQWQSSYLASDGILRSSFLFLKNVANLLLPGGGWFTLVSSAALLLGLAGALRIVVGLGRAERRAAHFFLVSCAPILIAIIVSFCRKYPLLDKPRFIIWMLPAVVMLILYASEPVWLWLEQLLIRTFHLKTKIALKGLSI